MSDIRIKDLSVTATSLAPDDWGAIDGATNGTRKIKLMANPMTAAADIIIGGTSGVPTRLSVGPESHVLTVVGGVPAWEAPTPMVATGDLIVGGTSGTATRLAIGTANQVLTVSGGALTWATPYTNPMTTAGDIIIGGTDGAATRLAKGSASQVLTIYGGTVYWRDAVGFANPMSATGDLILGGSSGTAGRLGIGSTGQVLTVSGGTAVWAAATGGFSNPMTTAGDLILGGSSGTAGRLGIGATGQVLTVSGGTAVWQNSASGFSNPMTTAGDLILGGSSGTAGRLGIGADGQVLTVSGGTATWQNSASGFSNPMTTTGDIIIGGSSGAATRLAAGTNAYVLTMVSGSPAWAAASGGGSGTVNSGTATQLAYYSSTGTAVSGNSLLTIDTVGKLTLTSTSTNTAELSLVSTGASTNQALVTFIKNGTTKGIFGMSGTSGGIVTGSADGDMAFRANGGSIWLSADSGTTAHLKIGASGLATHKTSASTSNVFVLDTTDSTGSIVSQLQFNFGGTEKGRVGTTLYAGGGIVGSSANDLFIRSTSGDILFSNDNGSTIRAKLSTTGTLTLLGAASSLSQFIFDTTTANYSDILRFNLVGTGKGYWGCSGDANSYITGNAVGDSFIRTETLNFNVSTNGGTAIGFQVVSGNGGIKTSAPSGGTAAAWKLGSLVTAAVTADTTRYIQLDVGGVLYKVIIAT